ncbi:hypothetical protein WBG78_05005 [Chryseolinea sp. T2]|uniref:hypothetical protein n=1 Tax=Chryseolinea sp. T2 TaxID=3129255 RepID=UPI003076C7E1
MMITPKEVLTFVNRPDFYGSDSNRRAHFLISKNTLETLLFELTLNELGFQFKRDSLNKTNWFYEVTMSQEQYSALLM